MVTSATRIAPRVEDPKMAPMMKPATMLTMARMIVPAQYLARLRRPSNDGNRYLKSKSIAFPPSRAGQLPLFTFVRPNGALAKGAICGGRPHQREPSKPGWFIKHCTGQYLGLGSPNS